MKNEINYQSLENNFVNFPNLAKIKLIDGKMRERNSNKGG
jgi:hypothetical protein